MAVKIVLRGQPRTKKNSMIRTKYGIIQSKTYRDYEKYCLAQMAMMDADGTLPLMISNPCNVKCTYYREDRRKCDLGNLLAATCDILVKGGVLEDDNYTIVYGHDGSRVYYDKDNPRVEIEIEENNDEQRQI